MDSDKKYWLDDPRNVNKIVYTLYAVCALLVLGDLLYHKHVHFEFEYWFGFAGFFGFIACVALVLAARLLRVVLKREEDYYDL
ncbi:MAG: hypothetical protein H8E66_10405 [Planctomycetes bacterium]|nr:hypothetical protein [Planctomycetota bacterium]